MTIKAIHGLIASQNLHPFQLYVKKVFLNGDLDEEVHMMIHPGYKFLHKIKIKHIYKLHKSYTDYNKP